MYLQLKACICCTLTDLRLGFEEVEGDGGGLDLLASMLDADGEKESGRTLPRVRKRGAGQDGGPKAKRQREKDDSRSDDSRPQPSVEDKMAQMQGKHCEVFISHTQSLT